ncbi:FUSC family membrane protein [Flavihumibacter sp. ZG627]|uniref:FUSC family protein n=1 Tax=Flavihumibacter sp. ZG627 TaxID=1463156 RepID=UPI00069377EE|nr:FUSC family membrane protein [Flavihumibacter sp. ZG627]
MIDYIRAYKKYSSSYYVSEGVRTTSGVMIPLLTASYFGELRMGIALGLGAMCVALTDNTGPIHHRKNGMVAALVLIFIMALLTGFAMNWPVLLALLIGVMGFACSIIGVYGVRVAAVGVAGLLVMILSIDERNNTDDVIRNAFLVAAGGLFYLILSLLLYKLRPYKLIQQALGDALISTGDYLRSRAAFYENGVDYENTYKNILEQQVQVHNKQNLVREMLFKTRDIVRESTHTSRILMMIFLDSVDLFERVMTSQQDYKQLHEQMDDTNLLPAFRNIILKLAAETEDIGLALQEGKASSPDTDLEREIRSVEENFLKLRISAMDDSNIEGFIGMRHILNSLKDLYARIETLHRYTSFDQKISDNFKRQIEYSKFVSPSDFNSKLLLNNLNADSNIFRHSIRVAISLVAGYFLSLVLPVEHGYWILLTILVILKPAYSLTKQRNLQRLGGTFAGAVIGTVFLLFIKDERALLTILILGMIIAYSMVRLKYMVSVIAMTVYILIAFHFLKPGDFTEVLRDRLIDTIAGSAIAFIATFAVPPRWEHEQIQDLLRETLKAIRNYFNFISKPFINEPLTNLDYKLHRKEAFVKLANLSDAFQRMLNEPRRQQKKVQVIHQMVVSNHMLASHIATLSSYRKLAEQYASDNFRHIIRASCKHLEIAEQTLRKDDIISKSPNDEENFLIREELKILLQQRLHELSEGSLDTSIRRRFSELKTIADQFEYINKISIELERLAVKLSFNSDHQASRVV